MARISIFNKEIEVTPGDIEEYPGNPGHALVVGEINKEAVKELFYQCDTKPCTEDGTPDNSYIGGEIQLIYDSYELSEILLFPCYKTEDGQTVGDYIPLHEHLGQKTFQDLKDFGDNCDPFGTISLGGA